MSQTREQNPPKWRIFWELHCPARKRSLCCAVCWLPNTYYILLHPITQFMNVVDVDLPYYLKYFKLAPVRESNRVHDASSLQLHTSSKCEKYKATKHGDFAEWSKRSGSTCQHRYDLKVSLLPKLCGFSPFPDSSFVRQDLCDETATQVSCWGKSNI